MSRHLTARGETIDMETLISNNSNQRALGNASMNARGDILNEKGVVLKTQEQIEAEWAAQRAKDKLLSGQPRNIKASLDQVVGNQPNPLSNPMIADKDFEPVVTTTTTTHPDVVPANTVKTSSPRRRIVETE